jgi:hypothetical protein
MLWVGAKRIKQFRNQLKQLTQSCHGNTSPKRLLAQANASIYLRYRSRERYQSYTRLLVEGGIAPLCARSAHLDWGN